ncbi:MAG: putative metal-binding motif-containing protein [Deltaproteobacteria bacterium]|nr:putative metal-binding motif-containing protein [Deltaproteobacteria bacterium]
MRFFPLLAFALGCLPSNPGGSVKDDTGGSGAVDADGDGYTVAEGDCDDSNAAAAPDLAESCDNVDNNCNGHVDEGALSTFYADVDQDGYGEAASASEACEAPSGAVTNADDCDDSNPDAFPGNAESCDEVDNNCNGAVDEGAASTFYPDADADGFGDSAAAVEACSMPEGTVENGDDCDDTTSSAYPGADEVCDEVDNDCNGTVDDAVQTTYYVDKDGDGYGSASVTDLACAVPTGYAENADDCNDGASAINPGATEVCDTRDNDCDGAVDEDDASDASTWYADVDADGYGNPDAAYAACEAPVGYVGNDEDCDDADPGINPDTEWYLDDDGDGFGDPDRSLVTCEPPADWILDDSDCDDSADSAYPGATEACNGIDDDCDTLVDDDDSGTTGASTWFFDGDGDGYGSPAYTTVSCDQPAGYAATDDDCDDTDGAWHPGAAEACDDPNDYDCDGTVEYADADADGFAACLDCDDADAAVNPEAREQCDGRDDDCDGDTDEDDAGDAAIWYADADGDGFGDAAATRTACEAPSGYTADATDCDDTDATVYPAADEHCDGVDHDCDGAVNEATSLDADSYYADADGDGYGAGAAVAACDPPSGYAATDDDCYDASDDAYPGQADCFDTDRGDGSYDYDCDGANDTVCLSIDSDTTDYDLFVAAGSPSAALAYELTVATGVVVGSTSTSTPALATGALPSGSTVTLHNYGIIVGHGGDGSGNVAYADDYGTEDGGPAIDLGAPTWIDNQGTIGGGGGGGGGGGDGDDASCCTTGTDATGGGGGGGAGYEAGEGGTRRQGQIVSGTAFGTDGSAGSLTTGGSGGAGICNNGVCSGAGGDGGDLGEAGEDGADGSGVNPGWGQVAGAAGAAVQTNGQVLTWTLEGDVRGDVE